MVKTIEADRARQGRRGVHLLLILIGGLALAMLVWVGVEIYGESIDQSVSTPPGQTEQPAQPSEPAGN